MIIGSIGCTITQIMEELISSGVNREGSQYGGGGSEQRDG